MSFRSQAKHIAAKQNIPIENAQAILASGARNASAKAKKKNPKLKRVKG